MEYRNLDGRGVKLSPDVISEIDGVLDGVAERGHHRRSGVKLSHGVISEIDGFLDFVAGRG